jgi:hypothetical protein
MGATLQFAYLEWADNWDSMEITFLFSHKIRPAAIETAFATALACKKAPSFYK